MTEAPDALNSQTKISGAEGRHSEVRCTQSFPHTLVVPHLSAAQIIWHGGKRRELRQ